MRQEKVVSPNRINSFVVDFYVFIWTWSVFGIFLCISNENKLDYIIFNVRAYFVSFFFFFSFIFVEKWNVKLLICFTVWDAYHASEQINCRADKVFFFTLLFIHFIPLRIFLKQQNDVNRCSQQRKWYWIGSDPMIFHCQIENDLHTSVQAF